jgi:hypothetical protein
VPAPPDADGNVVQTWGGPGPGYEWPEKVHGITVDAKDRVWITGNGDKDAHILAFTRGRAFLRQIGHQRKKGGSNDTANLGRSIQVRFDVGANEIYVSDGEMNENHRVIVFDADSGVYKRHWGAYGERPGRFGRGGSLQSERTAATAVQRSGALPADRSRWNRVCLRSRQQSV